MSKRATKFSEEIEDVTGDPNYPWRHPLPNGWQKSRLGDAIDIVRGISFPKDAKSPEPREGHVACLRTANVQKDVEWDDLWFVPEKYVKRDNQYVRPGDILISTANSYDLVGKVAPVTVMPHRATLGAFISLLRPREQLDAKFSYYQIAWSDTQDRIRATASTTTNISNVSTKKLSNIELALPPLDQQKRIVAEIEKQFSRLDEAVANLKRVKANLKRYKAAVLKAAVEGRLTENWRRTHTDVEPASHLLTRIFAERRVIWERVELGKMQLKGNQPANTRWKERYKPPVSSDEQPYVGMPSTWEQVSLDSVASLITDGKHGDCRNEAGSGYFFLSAKDVVNGELRYTEARQINRDDFLEVHYRTSLEYGDVLITNAGTIGRIAIAKDVKTIPYTTFQKSVAIIKPVRPYVLSAFIAYYLEAKVSEMQAKSAGTAVKNLLLSTLKNALFCLPPESEQFEIVAEVDRRLSLLRETETQVDANLQRAERIRQSILNSAFSKPSSKTVGQVNG